MYNIDSTNLLHSHTLKSGQILSIDIGTFNYPVLHTSLHVQFVLVGGEKITHVMVSTLKSTPFKKNQTKKAYINVCILLINNIQKCMQYQIFCN